MRSRIPERNMFLSGILSGWTLSGVHKDAASFRDFQSLLTSIVPERNMFLSGTIPPL